jgi:predicted acylesterase/phospholipase RssA
MAAFKIGINMAGAVSAGAYTAGVLDFLTEALDAWYKAKAAGEVVPAHDVSIEVFSGASAGGMCAAISAALLQQDFDHIHDTAPGPPTTNRFYESWVNQIDITALLKTDDLTKGHPVVSLLNSNIIEQIAAYALKIDGTLPPRRAYVSPRLTLFLSLTNLRGTPYSLNAAAPGSIEETTFFYGDRICFQTTRSGGADNSPLNLTGTATGAVNAPDRYVHNIDLDRPGMAGGWDVLQQAAMATGAFPLFLAPRVLWRRIKEYLPPHWESVTSSISGDPPPVPPNFPKDFQEPFPTLNVDGGITNNDPFNYAHDYLASLEPAHEDGLNPDSPMAADRAVIGIAPFPTVTPFDPKYDPKENSSVLSALPKLFSGLLSQSRFFGESLEQIMSGTTFNRFIIAPSDDELTRKHLQSGGSPLDQPPALQCALLSAFGGFLERDFRAHDYALGRRNCQKFLNDSFVLPGENPIMKEAFAGRDEAAQALLVKEYGRPAPGTYAHSVEELRAKGLSAPQAQQGMGDLWLPIIPLCTEALRTPIPQVPRGTMDRAKLDSIVTLILKRWKAVISHFIGLVPSWWGRMFLWPGQPFIRLLLRGPLTRALVRKLGDSYRA